MTGRAYALFAKKWQAGKVDSEARPHGPSSALLDERARTHRPYFLVPVLHVRQPSECVAHAGIGAGAPRKKGGQRNEQAGCFNNRPAHRLLACALVLPALQPMAQGAPHMQAQRSECGARRARRPKGDEQSGSAARGPSRATSQRAGPRPRRAQGGPRAGQREHAPFEVAEAGGDLKKEGRPLSLEEIRTVP